MRNRPNRKRQNRHAPRVARPAWQIMRGPNGLAMVADGDLARAKLPYPHLESEWPEMCGRCRCDRCQMERDVLAAGGSVEADGTFTVDAEWFRANFSPVTE